MNSYPHAIHVVNEDRMTPLIVGRVSDKNNMAQKNTYAETVANYVAPRVAPHIAIAPHM